MSSPIQYDPTRHGDMPEVWRRIGKPVEATLHIGYEDSVGTVVERQIDTRQFADLAFGPTILAHCHLRNALREFRIDRIRSCQDAAHQPVADVYRHLQALYENTPTFALDQLLYERKDALRVLLYLLETGGHAHGQVVTALTEACRELTQEQNIDAETVDDRIAPLLGADAESFRARVSRLSLRLPQDERHSLLKLADRLISDIGEPNLVQAEALEYLQERLLSNP